jgi:hypothetical protein
MVPMAPSSTKMRSLILSMKALRALGWDAFTTLVPDYAACPIMGRRPNRWQIA